MAYGERYTVIKNLRDAQTFHSDGAISVGFVKQGNSPVIIDNALKLTDSIPSITISNDLGYPDYSQYQIEFDTSSVDDKNLTVILQYLKLE